MHRHRLVKKGKSPDIREKGKKRGRTSSAETYVNHDEGKRLSVEGGALKKPGREGWYIQKKRVTKRLEGVTLKDNEPRKLLASPAGCGTKKFSDIILYVRGLH